MPAGELDPDQLRPHAQRFVRKHEADFFVHPQLRQFLEGELDYFLKNEFIAIWDNDTWDDNAGALGREREKFKIAREIGLSLIRFLGEIEDVQAALFEKRRFVTRCDYLVQASAVSAALRQSACENPAQVAEWAQWVGEKLTKPTKATARQGEALLARYPHLPIHTCHFDDAFTLALLAEFPDLDAATGGTLIHSENYGALRTLEPTYLGQVKCIYIDPPYNTDAGPILYKNEFKESSWLSLIESRISASRVLMQPTGALCLTIDDFEVSRVTLELFDEFGEANHWATVAIRSKPQGRATTSGFSVNHEYALFFGNSETSQVGRLPREGSRAERYAHRDDRGAYTWANFRKTGSDSLHDDRRQQYYPIYVFGINARVPEMKWDGTRKEWECKPPKAGEVVVWPTDADNVARVWSVGADRAVSDLGVGDIEVRKTPDGIALYRKYRPNEDGALPITWWADAKYSASESGTKLLQALGLEPKDLFPKSVFAVSDCIRALGCGAKDFTLDYFAGSGTTGHAVINLNREDGGTRKFLLVEMGEYFDTVMLPRIAKVMTSPEWKDGKPKEGVVQEAADDEHWSQRTLPVVKVLRLESYDDALNAIELEKDETDNDASLSLGGDSREADETLIRYVLGAAREENTLQPVWLNTEALDKPFDYALPTVVNGVASTLKVDLTETACLMLGLQPVRIRAAERAVSANGSSKSFAQRFRLVEGWLPQEGNKLALLVLHDYVAPKNGDEARAEYEWLKQTVVALFGHALADYAKLYYNRDMVFMGHEKFECVDGLLKRRMMERAAI